MATVLQGSTVAGAANLNRLAQLRGHFDEALLQAHGALAEPAGSALARSRARVLQLRQASQDLMATMPRDEAGDGGTLPALALQQAAGLLFGQLDGALQHAVAGQSDEAHRLMVGPVNAARAQAAAALDEATARQLARTDAGTAAAGQAAMDGRLWLLAALLLAATGGVGTLLALPRRRHAATSAMPERSVG